MTSNPWKSDPPVPRGSTVPTTKAPEPERPPEFYEAVRLSHWPLRILALLCILIIPAFVVVELVVGWRPNSIVELFAAAPLMALFIFIPNAAALFILRRATRLDIERLWPNHGYAIAKMIGGLAAVCLANIPIYGLLTMAYYWTMTAGPEGGGSGMGVAIPILFSVPLMLLVATIGVCLGALIYKITAWFK
jgi:hypothetical protein